MATKTSSATPRNSSANSVAARSVPVGIARTRSDNRIARDTRHPAGSLLGRRELHEREVAVEMAVVVGRVADHLPNSVFGVEFHARRFAVWMARTPSVWTRTL